ncbi:Transgelin [Paramyrothecium foliicola]|nr:Transgelin [Paramyrothecium foliicola]
MASVSSLDKDLRKMRLDKYTPAAANEARAWIEDILGERLPSGDLLEGLKDGVALCKLVNLAVPPPGVRFKKSAMPFVQMENISHFLRACQAPPLNLHQHDTFLTVDLYEQKDPAQVLQCLGAFSRAANVANPSRFPQPIGPRRSGLVSPERTGPTDFTGGRNRGISVTSNTSSAHGGRPVLPNRTGDSGSGRWSPTKSPSNGAASPGAVSSWSRKEHEGATSPAWNIAQYGYMGGASQGNLGIAFGARRQITSSGPSVPSLADKERRRREKEEEDQRLRQEAEEEERQRRAAMEAEEVRSRQEEERKWEEETRRLREEERVKAEQEKRKWEEEERQWKITEEARRKEEHDAEERLTSERESTRSRSDARLRGQFLSQYHAEQATTPEKDDYKSRVQELEKELELARQREAQYERERQGRTSVQGDDETPASRARSKSRSEKRSKSRSKSRSTQQPSRQDSWSRNEREVLRTSWNQHQEQQQAQQFSAKPSPPVKSPRPLPDPNAASKVQSPTPTLSGRPLPDPAAYTSPKSRTDRFLANNPAPPAAAAQQTYSRELGATSERDGEDRRRAQSQAQTKAGGWASKSLLEREMEMERQRQQEWEEAQKETAAAVRSADGVEGIGGGVGGRWDVSQWSGFTGGDSQNRGAQGIGSGRRQIVGPRPLPDPNR